MAPSLIPIENLDSISQKAVVTVFKSMIDADMTCSGTSCMLTNDGSDLLRKLPIQKGFYAITVGFVGDMSGKVMLILPVAAAFDFAQRLFDTPDLEWMGEDSEETLTDSLGELGNMLAGLFKGALTRWYPKLMLTTPRVSMNKRLKLDNSRLSFRRQYEFSGLANRLMIDFCCE